MVWPILISVAVTPRISAEVAATGSIRQATAPSAPNPMTQRIETQRIDLPPLLLPPRSDGAVAAHAKHAMTPPRTPSQFTQVGAPKAHGLPWPRARRPGSLIFRDHEFQSGPGIVDRADL